MQSIFTHILGVIMQNSLSTFWQQRLKSTTHDFNVHNQRVPRFGKSGLLALAATTCLSLANVVIGFSVGVSIPEILARTPLIDKPWKKITEKASCKKNEGTVVNTLDALALGALASFAVVLYNANNLGVSRKKPLCSMFILSALIGVTKKFLPKGEPKSR